ncbi:MAG: methyl-accepting chemotaxis protein [Hyphomicrobiales bacterium]|nr:methyl-accepting chemotaxis protein [Hyphomicrobiales bacterium]
MSSEAGNARNTMSELSSAAQEIGGVIKLINEIAEQTNLLALNATIEAARTGEAGKGFAVVATEMKNLAGQTTKATEEISSQINTLQIASESAEHNIGGVTDTILNLSELSNAVASAVEEQSTATGSISQNVQHAAAGSNEVAHGIETVSAVASETKEAAGKLQQLADTLSRQAGELNQRVFDFLNQVRAARWRRAAGLRGGGKRRACPFLDPRNAPDLPMRVKTPRKRKTPLKSGGNGTGFAQFATLPNIELFQNSCGMGCSDGWARLIPIIAQSGSTMLDGPWPMTIVPAIWRPGQWHQKEWIAHGSAACRLSSNHHFYRCVCGNRPCPDDRTVFDRGPEPRQRKTLGL